MQDQTREIQPQDGGRRQSGVRTAKSFKGVRKWLAYIGKDRTAGETTPVLFSDF